ncbi:MAG: hypothetical protein J6Q54_04875 [Oscillospiraceae bacterium]|nr:hypothetical protein [Oscillospiraceae bacterium]
MEELIEFILNLLGAGLFAAVFIAGGYVTGWLKKPLDKLAAQYHRNWNPLVVELTGKGVVILLCLLVCLSDFPAFTDILDAMLPIGSFEEITGQFAEGDKWLFNIFFNVFLEQFTLSFAYFIPFILVNLVLSLCKKFLCGTEYNTSYGEMAISYGTDILLLFFVNALVLRTGMLFPRLAAGLLAGYDLSAGLGKLIVLMIPVLLLLFAVFRDLIGSDLLMAILGLNIAAAMLNVQPDGSNRALLFVIAFVCSILSKLIKHWLPVRDDSFRGEAMGALGTLVGTGLVSWLLLSL